MNFFGGSSKGIRFEAFGISHLIVIGILVICIIGLFLVRNKLKELNLRKAEFVIAGFLVCADVLYNIWMVKNDIWRVSDSLPLQLCSISLYLVIILLLTRKKLVYEIVLFTGILGAMQAILTPYLFFGFPHFRFIHFFSTHSLIILVPFYFTWVRGYRPTLSSIGKVFIFLNILMPFIIFINKKTDGNYMFLGGKPETKSVLNYLGDYPYYIVSLEGVLLVLSLLLWLGLREKSKKVLKGTEIGM
ncbi:TIGR02206 family membrane protein [Bacillus sp. AFS041924]|uniref:YwaF family protein n=1 Tax=Bacillus sp. AFS041924 TaxID=2033503 RepID=UPI000BFD45AC|nr:TIGR02206 family membrane protein [Bacillus sp. AFS041924]PGS51665.1 TIGR02206 family membrane protein [Bacillus sp. AFS041924]